jgi:endonuclease/exonuclease/phosphatase family metal-dependent hydrolase
MFQKVPKKLMIAFLLLFSFGGFLLGAVIYNGRVIAETNLAKSILLGQSQAPLASEVTLKVVTFNIHDLYIASSHRDERMRGIAKTLNELDPDIVGIQESFIEKDRDTLLNLLSGTRLAYHQYYQSATVGCGLLVLSAYPIVEPFFHRFTRNGRWYEFYHGDWWAGKGAALARIQLPQGYLDFYNTHTHARYGSNAYEPDQESQMAELVQFIKNSALSWAPAFLVGDMNCTQDSKPYQIAAIGGGLTRLMDITSKIDHIFGVDNPHYKYEVLDTREIRDTVPAGAGEVELSDHPGYMSTIRITPAS